MKGDVKVFKMMVVCNFDYKNSQFLIHLDACGGLLEFSNGTIASPSFPELYPANKNCIWEIVAPPQWKITLNFTHFDIEGNNVRPHLKYIFLLAPFKIVIFFVNF